MGVTHPYVNDMSTFLDVVELLLTDGNAKDAYSADPNGFLNEHGLGDLDSTDVADAMLYASDALPLPVATQLNPSEGLDSAASLDLATQDLSLEREAYDAPLDDAADDMGLGDMAVGDDVDFDTPEETAIDAADAFDSPDGGGPMGDGAAGAVDPMGETQDAADELVDLESDTAAVADDEGSDAELDDLTSFVPVEDAVVETPDIRFDEELDDLDADDLADVETDDLDFLD